MYSPIAIFLYNRPDKALTCIKSLMKNNFFLDSPLYFFIDGPKNSSDIIKIEKIKQTINLFEFNNIEEIIFREKNIGLANSIFSGVQQVFKKYDRIIVIEDDLILHEYFLTFMNNCLEFYNYESIYHVSGFMWGGGFENKINIPLLIPNINSWGWGTWKTKWKGFELSQIDKNLVNNFTSDDIFRFNLNNSYNYFRILKKQLSGKVDSWAIQWYYYVFNKRGYTVYPHVSLVINNGMDGSGTHTLSNNFSNTFIQKFKINYPKLLLFERNKYEIFCEDLKIANSETLIKKIFLRVLNFFKR